MRKKKNWEICNNSLVVIKPVISQTLGSQVLYPSSCRETLVSKAIYFVRIDRLLAFRKKKLVKVREKSQGICLESGKVKILKKVRENWNNLKWQIKCHWWVKGTFVVAVISVMVFSKKSRKMSSKLIAFYEWAEKTTVGRDKKPLKYLALCICLVRYNFYFYQEKSQGIIRGFCKVISVAIFLCSWARIFPLTKPCLFAGLLLFGCSTETKFCLICRWWIVCFRLFPVFYPAQGVFTLRL